MNFVKPIALCAGLFATGSFAETAIINGSEIYYTTVGEGTPILMMAWRAWGWITAIFAPILTNSVIRLRWFIMTILATANQRAQKIIRF